VTPGLFADLQRAYAAAGFPDEWKLHHQGGSCGYNPRDRIGTPGNPTKIFDNQGFAWNPSITEFLPHRYDSLPAPFLGFRHDRRESHETRDGLHDGLHDRLAAAA